MSFAQAPTGFASRAIRFSRIRTHDQFNTTIYGKDERYRGIHHGRRAVLDAAYYPEPNVPVPLESVPDESGTPTSKLVVVRLGAVL
jgi:hypothetical protein